MRRLGWKSFAVTVVMIVLFSSYAGSQARSASAFEKLKTLAGTWETTAPNGEVFASAIRLVSNGATIQETFQSSEADQMVTLYTPDCDRLAMTHYCSAGNQPRMETASETSDAKVFEFRFTGITNLTSPEGGTRWAIPWRSRITITSASNGPGGRTARSVPKLCGS